MRFLALFCIGFVVSGCGLFHGIDSESGVTAPLDDTGATVETGETGDTVDTSDTVDTGEGPNDVEPKSGDYDFFWSGTFSDECGMFGGEMPWEVGDQLFEGNATVHSSGVKWIIDGDSEVEAQWVGDDKFEGVIADLAESEAVDGLNATYVMEGVWSGEWSTDVDLSGFVGMTIRCIGQDCQEAETMYYDNSGVMLPCETSYVVGGAFAR
jgi:hypothetical protein